ncbi:hypothetical protein ACN28E_35550 [Archangium lansingense]|uniref:hypothetical protein n=1 Tax=Archangium lansingense TaxID=2995310 RepID=UPI003B80D414
MASLKFGQNLRLEVRAHTQAVPEGMALGVEVTKCLPGERLVITLLQAGQRGLRGMLAKAERAIFQTEVQANRNGEVLLSWLPLALQAGQYKLLVNSQRGAAALPLSF